MVINELVPTSSDIAVKPRVFGIRNGKTKSGKKITFLLLTIRKFREYHARASN